MTATCAVGRWLCDRARVAPDRPALRCDGDAISYSRLHAASHQAAAAMGGLVRGDRVAVLAGNCPEYVALLFAAAHRGVMVVPLNPRQSARELAYQVVHSGASLLVTDRPRGPLAGETLTGLTGAGHTPPAVAQMEDIVPLAAAGGAGRCRPPGCPATPAVLDDDAPLLLVYTSGTTGRPKGAVLTHANVFWTNLAFDRLADIGPHDVVLQLLPQFHVGGWNCQPLLAWWKGASVVLERSFDPDRALRLVARHGVTTMMGVPAMYQAMAAADTFATADLSSLRYVLVGGAPMPEALLERWHGRGVPILQGYGLTEASPNVLCVPAAEAHRRIGSAGVAYPHVDVALADPEHGNVLEGPAEGELLVRGPSVFAGYWRDPEATASAVRGGWLHTGDIAARDAEGFYRIKDRLKDMYISGGENVYPAEVETVLAGHPGIADAAVLGVPDERWGEAGLAVVVLAPGAAATGDEVRAWCAGRLARYKVPREVQFLDALPRSAVGKVDKVVLRSRFGSGSR